MSYSAWPLPYQAFKFSTWIYKIAHNAAIDYLRRHTVREQALTGSIDGDRREISIESRRLTPEQESERRERRSEIESVVQLLPAAYRDRGGPAYQLGDEYWRSRGNYVINWGPVQQPFGGGPRPTAWAPFGYTDFANRTLPRKVSR